jgi:hypothetical protein
MGKNVSSSNSSMRWSWKRWPLNWRQEEDRQLKIQRVLYPPRKSNIRGRDDIKLLNNEMIEERGPK